MIDPLRAAAIQALENCTSEYGHRCNHCDSEIDGSGKVVATLRAALAQTSEEPVAWWIRTGHGTGWRQGATPPVDGVGWQPLYAAPLPAPARVPLPSGELARCILMVNDPWNRMRGVALEQFARAIEAAHGIKENNSGQS